MKRKSDVIDLTEEGNQEIAAAQGPECLRFTLLSYNIDGLNEEAVDERWQFGVHNVIIRENPDVIFFQEVTPHLMLKILQLKSLGFICSDNAASIVDLGHYFSFALCKQAWLTKINATLSFTRVPYTGRAKSNQGRNILKSVIKLSHGSEVVLLNLHLESCGKAFESVESNIRVAQLKAALNIITTHQGPAICGGDLNIRDAEAKAVLKEFSAIDAAEQLKMPKNTWNTWFLPGNERVACRFDRLYSNQNHELKAIAIHKVGDEELPLTVDCSYCTASDHRGLVVKYETSIPQPSNIQQTTNSTLGHKFSVQSNLNLPSDKTGALGSSSVDDRRKKRLEAALKRQKEV